MYEHISAYHRLFVSDVNGVRMLKFERNRQSSMSLDDPFETDIEYVGYFHLALAFNRDIKRVLVIGLGGGTVVKRMWRDYPWMRIDAVEIDPEVVRIAYGLFALPEDERLRVFIGDGRDFLTDNPDAYDLIIVDAFDDDQVPHRLLTEEFMMLAHDHLAENGVLAYNFIGALYGPRSKPFRSLHRTAGNIWRGLTVFAVGLGDDAADNTRNLLLFATEKRLAHDELLASIESRVGGMVTVPAFERYGEDLYQGSIRRGDVPLITDAPPPSRHGHRGWRRR